MLEGSGMDSHSINTRCRTSSGWWRGEDFSVHQIGARGQRTVERPIRRLVDLIVRSKGQKTPTPRKVLRRETDMPQRLLPCSAWPHIYERKVPAVLSVN